MPSAVPAPMPTKRRPEFWESLVPRPFFWHLRNYDDESGEVIPTGGTTLAWRYFKDLDQVHLSIAFCNTVDHFSRLRGRLLAAGRLLSPEREIMNTEPKLRTLNDRDLRKALTKLLEEFELRQLAAWNLRRGQDPDEIR